MRRSDARVVRYAAALLILLGAALASRVIGLDYAAIPLVAGGAFVAALLIIAVRNDGDARGNGPGGGRGGRHDDRVGRPMPIRVRSDDGRRRRS
jgi:hypothetical protein